MSDQGVQQKEQWEKTKALELHQWNADLQWLMENAAGQRIIGRFLSEVRKRPFTVDDRVTSYNLGRLEFIRDFTDALRTANISLFQATERSYHEKTSHA